MNVLVVGGGGREHALAWSIRKSSTLENLFVAPGNGGTEGIAQNVSLPPDSVDAIFDFARERHIDLTVIGPEAPLVKGVVDRFRAANLACFGPTQAAARLEGSKVFAKRFMHKYGIPTAHFEVCEDAEAARRFTRDHGVPVVVKADGLAQGKGVIVASTIEEADGAIDDIMVKRKFGDSGRRVVVEECLTGQEVSVHAICGGGRAFMFPSSQDHKRIFDNDEGPNTGGMGAYAPVPIMTETLRNEVLERIVLPTLRGMAEEGAPYDGVLYVGLMVTDDGPKVLEYNVRFGDPETQVLLPLLEHDVLDILDHVARGDLPSAIASYQGRCAATVVVASEGYPGSYRKGARVSGLDRIEDDRRVVFHAGTAVTDEGLVTAGGRVFAVTAWSDDLHDAIRHAYGGVEQIRFDGAYWRTDIGKKALEWR